jgi:hypothetical protein
MSVVRLPRRSFSVDDRYTAWPLRRDGQWVLEVFHDGETGCEVPLDQVLALHEVRASSPKLRRRRSASLSRRPWWLLRVPVLISLRSLLGWEVV